MPHPLNIAHRGARSLAPENTLPAALKAFALGAPAWELDVTASADGELIVLHDDTLTRTSNAAEVFPDRAPWLAHTFTLAELRALDFGSWFAAKDPFGQIASGAVSPSELAGYAGLPIPTLRQALELTRQAGRFVNVEIKDASGTPADRTIVEQVVALVQSLEMTRSVLISSFNHTYLARVRAANARIATAALVEGPHPDPVALLRELDAQAYNPGLKQLDRSQIDPLRAAGYDVYVWTVNEEADLRELLAAGVSGLFTDFPQRLAAILSETGSA
jgi:glycerophosphoryl diester phosphodiesterase